MSELCKVACATGGTGGTRVFDVAAAEGTRMTLTTTSTSEFSIGNDELMGTDVAIERADPLEASTDPFSGCTPSRTVFAERGAGFAVGRRWVVADVAAGGAATTGAFNARRSGLNPANGAAAETPIATRGGLILLMTSRFFCRRISAMLAMRGLARTGCTTAAVSDEMTPVDGAAEGIGVSWSADDAGGAGATMVAWNGLVGADASGTGDDEETGETAPVVSEAGGAGSWAL
ncbi:hypothetical protein PI124_g18847 [Phytophthora idaei]|nr:hypothetical protein PI125_g19772 [Phytophthora idaei]KAG3135421.1 hypothetical protein PI126_g18264 [Phytophthora idaei]KAG3236139.1 hypothetical protein PI124_g18847 [Phytophthora idaei]